jgi:solute carrier family 25 folate transporter 32
MSQSTSALAQTARQLRNSAGPYRGVWHAARQIAREEGIRGFYKGLLPSLLLVSHGAIQFMVYEELKELAAGAHRYAKDGGNPTLSATQIAFMGAASKLVASVTTYPSQVIRSRLQQRQDANRPVQYKSVLDTLKLIVKREGVGGLYKGIVPNVLRVMPQSAITFLVYEKVLQLLDSRSVQQPLDTTVRHA